MTARQGTRCHVLQKDVPHGRAEVQLVGGGGRHAATTDGERVRGARVCGGEGRTGPNARGRTPAAPLTDALGVVRRGVLAPISGESGDRGAGRGFKGQGQKGEATAGTREGGDNGGQAAARGKGAEVVAAEAGRKEEERGEPAAAKPRAELTNLAESDRLGGSVVADILVVSEGEEDGTRRMAVAGGHRQPTAPNVVAAVLKSILLPVWRKEEGKGRRGRTGAGAAEGGKSRVRTGGQGQHGKGGKGQVGASGAKKAAGQQEGKEGKG